MIDLQILILNPVISLLSALMVYYLLQKKAEKTINYYKNQLKKEAEAWLNSETGVKALYSIGAMVGNGAKDSIGIGAKGGKFKFQDLLAQIGISWAQKNLPGLGLNPSQNPQQSLNNESKDKRNVLRSA